MMQCCYAVEFQKLAAGYETSPVMSTSAYMKHEKLPL